jgi:hypothetical protein
LIAFGIGEESSGFDEAAAFARDDDTVEATDGVIGDWVWASCRPLSSGLTSDC